MTQETFGNKLNANGKTMKKKQMWILEGSGDGKTICLKSHLGKYLIVDKFGNVTCDSEEKEGNDNPKFEASIMADKSGRIAFKSVSRGKCLFICDKRGGTWWKHRDLWIGYFLGASSDELVCSAKSPGEAELWSVNLAARPQVILNPDNQTMLSNASSGEPQEYWEEKVRSLEWQQDRNTSEKMKPICISTHRKKGWYVDVGGREHALGQRRAFYLAVPGREQKVGFDLKER